LRQKGDLQNAAIELRAGVDERPDDAQAHHLLGATLVKLGRIDEGLIALGRAIELDPLLTEARVARAQTLARKGLVDAAREEQAEVQRINRASAAIGRAMILIETGRAQAREGLRERAVAALRDAAQTSPELAEAHYQLGLALLTPPEQPSEAEAAFLRAVERDPSRADAYYQLGMLRAKRRDDASALDALTRAAALRPSLVEAHRELANLARARHDWTAAVDALDAVLAWDPTDTRAQEERQHAVDAKAHEARRQ
jgi:tetratricopeptide (TPR) repeat protein